MTATAAQIADVRRMTAEPSIDTYSDALVADFIERYPHIDEQGEEPFTLSSDTPPVHEDNDDWMPTYDLHAAAGDIWEEKAANVAHRVDFAADGGNYSMSNQYLQYMAMARNHRSRRLPSTARAHKSPKEVEPALWIGNLPESD